MDEQNRDQGELYSADALSVDDILAEFKRDERAMVEEQSPAADAPYEPEAEEAAYAPSDTDGARYADADAYDDYEYEEEAEAVRSRSRLALTSSKSS